MRHHQLPAILFALAVYLLAGAATGQEVEFKLTVRNHKFEPAELAVPAGKKIKLVIDNQDSTPEEFESYELNREKVIAANSSAVVYVGPLKEGRYPFFGDFNKQTAQGALIAK